MNNYYKLQSLSMLNMSPNIIQNLSRLENLIPELKKINDAYKILDGVEWGPELFHLLDLLNENKKQNTEFFGSLKNILVNEEPNEEIDENKFMGGCLHHVKKMARKGLNRDLRSRDSYLTDEQRYHLNEVKNCPTQSEYKNIKKSECKNTKKFRSDYRLYNVLKKSIKRKN